MAYDILLLYRRTAVPEEATEERMLHMSTLLSAKDVQERLGISESTLFRMLKNKELKGFKVGGRAWRFEESDIEDYIQRQRQKAEQEQKEPDAA